MFIKGVTTALALLTAAVSAAPANMGITRLDTFEKRDVASTLAPHLSRGSTIVFPQDKNWLNVTERWTKYEAPSFQIAVEPATEEDVVAIVSHKACQPYIALLTL